MRSALAPHVLVLLLLGGCPGLQPPGDLPSVPYHTLPGTAAELRQAADHIFHTSRKIDELVRARTALKKAEYLAPDHYGTLWRLARINGVLARIDDRFGESWAQEGRDAADAARRLRPARVEGHLQYAICTGFLARYRPSQAERLSKELISAAELANKADPDYNGGEARRLLGAIYIYAPPWPSGVGDLDEAIDVLEALVKDHPRDPLNLYYLAEAYRHAEQPRDAVRLYRRVRRFPPRGLWRLEGPRYRARAREYITLLRRGMTGR